MMLEQRVSESGYKVARGILGQLLRVTEEDVCKIRLYGDGAKQDFIVARDRAAPTRLIRPLEIPRLFRRFADIYPASDAAIIDLANKFGPLFSEQAFIFTSETRSEPRRGAPLNQCKLEIGALRAAVEVANLIETNDTDALSQVISWSDASATVQFKRGRTLKNLEHYEVQYASVRARPSEVLGAAKIFVHGSTNTLRTGSS